MQEKLMEEKRQSMEEERLRKQEIAEEFKEQHICRELKAMQDAEQLRNEAAEKVVQLQKELASAEANLKNANVNLEAATEKLLSHYKPSVRAKSNAKKADRATQTTKIKSQLVDENSIAHAIELDKKRNGSLRPT